MKEHTKIVLLGAAAYLITSFFQYDLTLVKVPQFSERNAYVDDTLSTVDNRINELQSRTDNEIESINKRLKMIEEKLCKK